MAFIVDAVIVWFALFLVGEVIVAIAGTGNGAAGATFIIGLAVLFSYFALLNGSPAGQTVGMMLVHIAVRDIDTGGSIGIARALGRTVFEYLLLSLFILPWVIDVLFPLWDAQRQCIHDKAVRSIVAEVTRGTNPNEPY